MFFNNIKKVKWRLSFDRFINRYDMNEKNSEFKNMSIETSQTKMKNKNNENYR